MTGQYNKILSIGVTLGMLIAATGAKSQGIVLQDDFETEANAGCLKTPLTCGANGWIWSSGFNPNTGKDGLLHVWQNGRQIVDYQGALGFKDDESEIYFKLGLYRDRINLPMRIVYDRFRRGKSYKAVSIPTR